MSVDVPMKRLRVELQGRGNVAYLLTVGDDGRPHSVAVSVRWETEELVMRSGTASTRNAATRRLVTLLTPPVGPSAAESADDAAGRSAVERGYSLIVDGVVIAATPDEGGGGTVRVRPTHAVLHRSAAGAPGAVGKNPPDGAEAHDCDHVFEETQTSRPAPLIERPT